MRLVNVLFLLLFLGAPISYGQEVFDGRDQDDPYVIFTDGTNALMAMQVTARYYETNAVINELPSAIVTNELYANSLEMFNYSKIQQAIGFTGNVIALARYDWGTYSRLLVRTEDGTNTSDDVVPFEWSAGEWHIDHSLNDFDNLFDTAITMHPSLLNPFTTNYICADTSQMLRYSDVASNSTDSVSFFAKIDDVGSAPIDELNAAQYPHISRLLGLAATTNVSVFREAYSTNLFPERDTDFLLRSNVYEAIMFNLSEANYKLVAEIRGDSRILDVIQRKSSSDIEDAGLWLFVKEGSDWYLTPWFYNPTNTTDEATTANTILRNANLGNWLRSMIKQEVSATAGFESSAMVFSEGLSNAQVNVKISWPVDSGSGSVDYRIENAVALPNVDFYMATNGTLSFTGNMTDASIDLDIQFDGSNESNETFEIVLENPSLGLNIGANDRLVVSIEDNDTNIVPTISFVSPVVLLREGIQAYELGVVLSKPWINDMFINYSIHDCVASNGLDYTFDSYIGAGNTTGTFSIARGGVRGNIYFDSLPDAEEEVNEDFYVVLQGDVSNAVWPGETPQCRVLIENISHVPCAQFSDFGAAVSETNTLVSVGIVLSEPAATAVHIDYSVAGGTASNGVDFNLSALGSLLVAAGETATNLVVQINDDTNPESNETIVIHIDGVSGSGFVVGEDADFTIVIFDNDE